MQEDLRKRTKQFALRIIKLYLAVPQKGVGYVLGPHLLKAGTSVGAHYREACRAKSNADFISKIEGALQELDETTYWLELLSEGGVVAPKRLVPLITEADELIRIFVVMVKNVKLRRRTRNA
ncbi:MAG TPA: four helix bundle protein [Pyrinomonadaceae bacterium]|nr:four helix bundle protein [Pyrinomonadaceae bacterium]